LKEGKLIVPVSPPGFETAYIIITVATLFTSAYFLQQIIKPEGLADIALTCFCLITAQIVVIGYFLSFFQWLAAIDSWALAGLAAACLSAIVAALILKRAPLRPTFRIGGMKGSLFKHTSRFERLILFPLMLTVLVIGAIHLVFIVSTAPGNWDSMTYHLARVAYYIQHNSLASFDANYWAQTVHPKNSTILILLSYLVSGRNENLTQLVQFIAYWIAVLSVYGISRKTGNSRSRSMFAAMVSALLIDWLMEAPTTQNDMILTAYFGSALFFLFAFKEDYKSKYLVLSSVSIGLAIGTKSAALLPLVSVLAVAAHIFWTMISTNRMRSVLLWGVSLIAAVIVFALPAGYVENYLDFGNPIAPEQVRKDHSFEGKTIEYIAHHGTKNMIRYGLDFLSLDGIPQGRLVNDLQVWLRDIPKRIIHKFDVSLSTDEATRSPFELYRLPSSNEDTAYWGILGFGLVWPVVFLSLLGFSRSENARILAAAAILFFVVQSFAGPYDPWRGRYFIVCAIFAVPLVGPLVESSSTFLRGYVFVISLLGCSSAFSAVLFKANTPLLTKIDETEYTLSTFALTREEQLTRNRILYTKPIIEFEKQVQADATVAVFLRENSYEYPLFGRHLTRRIIPINSFLMGNLPVPAEAQYLLYDRTYPDSLRTDCFLGEDWYLRKIKE